MRWGVACGALRVLLSARHADASLIQVEFATTVVGSPLGDVSFFGDFIYDDLGSGDCLVTSTPCDPGFFVSFDDLNLYFGAHHYTLADASTAVTPQVLLPLGSNGWGPSYEVDAALMPLGVTAIGISPGAAVFPYVFFETGAFFLSQCPTAACSLSVTQLPPHSVPGPTSLALAALGGSLAWLGRRRRIQGS
jgi:hypothetical protein